MSVGPTPPLLLLCLTAIWQVGSTCPGSGWTEKFNRCFLPLFPVNDTGFSKMTHLEAMLACDNIQPGSTLPAVHKEEENTFLASLALSINYPIWLGITNPSGTWWEWQDRSVVDYTNFGSTAQRYDCAMMDPGGGWNVNPCQYYPSKSDPTYYVVCQYPAHP